MERNLKIILTRKRLGIFVSMTAFFAWTLMSGPVLAGEADGPGGPDDEFAPGFSGYVQPMVGVMSTKSNSDVGDDNEKIDSLDQDADSETQVMPMVLFNLNYTLENRATRFYIGTSEEEIIEGAFLFEAGVRHKLSGGTVLSAGWVPTLPLLEEEVWKDPFLTGSNREKTDRDTQAFRIGAERIFGTPLTLRYGFAQQEIDDDRAGESVAGLSAGDLAKLKRDANFHLAEVLFPISLDIGLMITPQAGYMIGDADGDANSFKRYQGQLTIEYPLDKWMFFGNINLARSDYDESNPVFNKTREDTSCGAMLGAGYRAPFGWENWMINIYASWEERDSNIKFYDRTNSMAGIGMTWRF